METEKRRQWCPSHTLCLKHVLNYSLWGLVLICCVAPWHHCLRTGLLIFLTWTIPAYWFGSPLLPGLLNWPCLIFGNFDAQVLPDPHFQLRGLTDKIIFLPLALDFQLLFHCTYSAPLSFHFGFGFSFSTASAVIFILHIFYTLRQGHKYGCCMVCSVSERIYKIFLPQNKMCQNQTKYPKWFLSCQEIMQFFRPRLWIFLPNSQKISAFFREKNILGKCIRNTGWRRHGYWGPRPPVPIFFAGLQVECGPLPTIYICTSPGWPANGENLDITGNFLKKLLSLQRNISSITVQLRSSSKTTNLKAFASLVARQSDLFSRQPKGLRGFFPSR